MEDINGERDQQIVECQLCKRRHSEHAQIVAGVYKSNILRNKFANMQPTEANPIYFMICSSIINIYLK